MLEGAAFLIMSFRKEIVLCSRDGCVLVLNVYINPRTKAKGHYSLLTSLFTVKQVLYQHRLKGHSARKKPLVQKQHKSPGCSLEMHSGTETLIFKYSSCGLMNLK
ncbi:hypothetical protein XENOCAPTIV_008100 [Xenoophorus captivus]|uniref:Uncharacterized protein n=1 Tax=Xenoophorus captivus TaxID=1517983 RepID=A0ABV0QZ57_9TELE